MGVKKQCLDFSMGWFIAFIGTFKKQLAAVIKVILLIRNVSELLGASI